MLMECGGSGGSLPYSMDELTTTGINTSRLNPIFGGWVQKDKKFYINGLFELLIDISSVGTFPNISGYDMVLNIPIPKSGSASTMSGVLVKKDGNRWVQQAIMYALVYPNAALSTAWLSFAFFEAITRGSDRYAIRIIGEYDTD